MDFQFIRHVQQFIRHVQTVMTFINKYQDFHQECLSEGVQKGWGVWGTPPGEKKSIFLILVLKMAYFN